MTRRLQFGLIVILLIFVLINLAVVTIFQGRMLPGVSIAGQPIGWKTQAQTRQLLTQSPPDAKLTITVAPQQFSLTGSQIDLTYDTAATTERAYQIGRSSIPLWGLWSSLRHGAIGYVYQYNGQKLSKLTTSFADQIGHPAINATIKVVNGVIQPVPDQDGMSVSADTLQQYIINSLNNDVNNGASSQIHLSPRLTTADVQVAQLTSAQDQAQQYLERKITLDYNGHSYTATPTNIGYWLEFTPGNTAQTRHQLIVSINPSQVKGWVQSVANQIDIPTKNQEITVRNGVSTVTQVGQNGLAINQDAANNAIVAAMRQNQDLTYDLQAGPVAFRTVTSTSSGPTDARYIEVSLSNQHLWVWQDGQVIFESPITSGAAGAGFGTVTGIFHIYYKTTNTYLNGHPYGWDYNVFVQYWMPFYLGYGLHDASWRSSFGGQDYFNGGSHGCVNMPLASAAFLYSWSSVGTAVWVHQ